MQMYIWSSLYQAISLSSSMLSGRGTDCTEISMEIWFQLSVTLGLLVDRNNKLSECASDLLLSCDFF